MRSAWRGRGPEDLHAEAGQVVVRRRRRPSSRWRSRPGPNVAGHELRLRGPLDEVLEPAGEEVVVEAPSRPLALEPVTTPCRRASAASAPAASRPSSPDPPDRVVACVRSGDTMRRRHRRRPLDRAPVERAVGRSGRRTTANDGDGEDQHRPRGRTRPSSPVDHRVRVEEDDLDVEDDEDHRRRGRSAPGSAPAAPGRARCRTRRARLRSLGTRRQQTGCHEGAGRHRGQPHHEDDRQVLGEVRRDTMSAHLS